MEKHSRNCSNQHVTSYCLPSTFVWGDIEIPQCFHPPCFFFSALTRRCCLLCQTQSWQRRPSQWWMKRWPSQSWGCSWLADCQWACSSAQVATGPSWRLQPRRRSCRVPNRSGHSRWHLTHEDPLLYIILDPILHHRHSRIESAL